MSGMICPNPGCKNTIAGPGDKYCYRCGTEMVAIGPCECGRDLVACDKFCPKCGKKVSFVGTKVSDRPDDKLYDGDGNLREPAVPQP